LRGPSGAALAAFVVYLGLVAATGNLPLLRFPVFQFARPDGPTVAPWFAADGQRADIEDFERFAGVGPDDVDRERLGFQSSVQHKFDEQARWLGDHPGTDQGPVAVQVGLRILDLGPDGRVHEQVRVDGEGTAWPRR
jgi:hypothetical protein